MVNSIVMTAENSSPTTPASISNRDLRKLDELLPVSMRIATLARLLGVSLGSEADVTSLLARTHGAFQTEPESKPGGRASIKSRELEELRGLLALRCELMAQLVSEHGLEAVHAVTQQVRDHLAHVGLHEQDHGFLLGSKIDQFFADK